MGGHERGAAPSAADERRRGGRTGVEVVLPGVLADLAGGSRHVRVEPGGGTLADLLVALAAAHPTLVRRIRDEAGALRRFVNVYVDGDDVRYAGGLGAPVPDGAVVQVLPSVAGG